jgi:hypothetical protein
MAVNQRPGRFSPTGQVWSHRNQTNEPKTWQVFFNRPGLVASKPNQLTKDLAGFPQPARSGRIETKPMNQRPGRFFPTGQVWSHRNQTNEPKTWQVFPNRPGLVASKPNQ